MENGKDSSSLFAKPRRNRGNVRKRAVDEEEASEKAENTESEVNRVAKQQKLAVNAFTTKQDTKEGSTKHVKHMYDSDRRLQQADDQGATRANEAETAIDRDARAQREKVLAQANEGDKVDDGLYKGATGYKDYRAGFRREHTIGAEKGGGAHGPLRAPSNIRMTVRFDYQPDICKDYKETGYCGYGDACKFIHDRGDYKSGWELDREWNERQKRLEESKWGEEDEDGNDENSEDDEDEIPFACYICRKPWSETADPVVTKCKHYFCEPCALRHNSLNKGKCAVCEQQTNGIFNIATEVSKKFKQKR